jgi:ribose transport system substrate-binding protein
MMTTRARQLLALGGAGLALSAVAGCGSSDSSSDATSTSAGQQTGASSTTSPATSAANVTQLRSKELTVDVSKYCGTKPAKVGILDGVGNNPFRIETRAMLTNLAKKCPNVTDVLYFDAGGDPQKYNSTVASWAAQGVNVIVTIPDFGQASVPAFRNAQRRGVKVVTHNSIAGNAAVPTDITGAVVPNFKTTAASWIDFIKKTKGPKAKILYLGGPTGNGFDTSEMADVKAAIAKDAPDMELLDANPIDTGWDPAKTQQVTAGLISKYPQIDGILMSYIATSPSVIKAFKAAGKTDFPAIAGAASSNQVVCMVKDTNDAKPGSLPMISLDAAGNMGPIALSKGLAAYEGIDAPELGPTDEPTLARYATYVDTATDTVPQCDPTLPAYADLSHALTLDEIKAVLK